MLLPRVDDFAAWAPVQRSAAVPAAILPCVLVWLGLPEHFRRFRLQVSCWTAPKAAQTALSVPSSGWGPARACYRSGARGVLPRPPPAGQKVLPATHLPEVPC